MILMYHKVAPDAPTPWWVEVDAFYRQLCELRAKEVVFLDAYQPSNPRHCVITFDGVYQNILLYAAPLLKRFGYPFELFLTSDYLGLMNEFDAGSGEPPAVFTTKDELSALVEMGGRLQWHTRSHPHLGTLVDEAQIRRELEVPPDLRALDPKGFGWIAYPHGEFSPRVREIASQSFRGAVSCNQGSVDDRYALNRITVTNETRLAKASIGVVVPSYRYGHFLPEALESLLRQTRSPDKIFIADDCSPDNTPEVGEAYASKYPHLIQYRRNQTNLGIIENFNSAVRALGTDYVVFLGADNRFRSDFVEECAGVLDRVDDVGVAYTDYAMFGALAPLEYERLERTQQGGVLEQTYYRVTFPDFESAGVERLRRGNYIHGSSMYRRAAFEQVGGYLEAGHAEDHNLFLRMCERGWKAKRVPLPLLEYRKHSLDQANSRLISQAELNFYKELVREKDRQIAELRASLASEGSLAKFLLLRVRALLEVLYRALPKGLRSTLQAWIRQFLIACQKCEHPIFRLRFLVPTSLRKKVGKMIWQTQKQHFK